MGFRVRPMAKRAPPPMNKTRNPAARMTRRFMTGGRPPPRSSAPRTTASPLRFWLATGSSPLCQGRRWRLAGQRGPTGARRLRNETRVPGARLSCAKSLGAKKAAQAPATLRLGIGSTRGRARRGRQSPRHSGRGEIGIAVAATTANRPPPQSGVWTCRACSVGFNPGLLTEVTSDGTSRQSRHRAQWTQKAAPAQEKGATASAPPRPEANASTAGTLSSATASQISGLSMRQASPSAMAIEGQKA